MVLQTQRTMDTGQTPYGCIFCDKSFSEPGDLKTHLSTHENPPQKFTGNSHRNSLGNPPEIILEIHIEIHMVAERCLAEPGRAVDGSM